ncbi:dihydroorotate dehydrogenase, type 2 [Gammaproteobacteria bacterium]
MGLDIYPLIRPLLFHLDPEVAHRFTLTTLAQVHRLGLLAPFMPRRVECPRTVMGLRFPNPVGLAAGLDKEGECLEALGALGFGFVEVGTVTPRPQPGNPRPRMFRLPAAQALINRMGFNNQGVEALVGRLRRVHFDGIIGVNIGKNRDTPLEEAVADYLICLRRVYSYADYVAINISSPNTPQLRRLQTGAALSHLLATLKAEQGRLADEYRRTVPLAIKIAPDLSPEEVTDLAHILLTEGVDGVIATNTTVAREAIAHLHHGTEEGGLSGAPLAARATAVVEGLHAVLGERIPIIGSGGILTPADALARQAAGAALVQLYTGLIYRGPMLVTEVARAFCITS